jgi:hypothetical protein
MHAEKGCHLSACMHDARLWGRIPAHYVTSGRERKIRMDFSQFSFELDGWQVGLGRLVHLQVKQTKRREK